MKLLKRIEQLNEAYKAAFEKIKVENNRHNEAKAVLNANKQKYNDATIREESEKIKKDHSANINAIKGEYAEVVARIREEHEKEAFLEFTPNGAALNAEDVALFKSGIVLSAEEVEHYAKKYADNVTMLRVVKGYARDYEIETSAEINKTFRQAEGKFDIAKEAFERVVAKSQAAMQAVILNEANFDEVHAKFIDKAAQYIEEYKTEMQIVEE